MVSGVQNHLIAVGIRSQTRAKTIAKGMYGMPKNLPTSTASILRAVKAPVDADTPSLTGLTNGLRGVVANLIEEVDQ